MAPSYLTAGPSASMGDSSPWPAPSLELSCSTEATPSSTDGSSMWAAPAMVPSYITADANSSLAASTPQPLHITPTPVNRSLWAAPAEPPSPSLYYSSQSTTEYTQPITPIAHPTNHPILGHYRQDTTPTNTLISPSLSPINLHQPLNETYTYNQT